MHSQQQDRNVRSISVKHEYIDLQFYQMSPLHNPTLFSSTAYLLLGYTDSSSAFSSARTYLVQQQQQAVVRTALTASTGSVLLSYTSMCPSGTYHTLRYIRSPSWLLQGRSTHRTDPYNRDNNTLPGTTLGMPVRFAVTRCPWRIEPVDSTLIYAPRCWVSALWCVGE